MTHVYSESLRKGTTVIIGEVTIIGTKEIKKENGVRIWLESKKEEIPTS